MEVILLHDVPRLGRKNELKQVKEGYGRNFLIRRGLAVEATAASKERAKQAELQAETETRAKHDRWQANLTKLEAITVTLKGKANEQGHLFVGIKKEDILAALAKTHHLEINPDELLLAKPLKVVGPQKIPLKSGGELKVEIISKA